MRVSYRQKGNLKKSRLEVATIPIDAARVGSRRVKRWTRAILRHGYGRPGIFPMKTLTEYLNFHTQTHRAYVHITPRVEEILRKSGIREGMVLVSAVHITAGVYVNDNESGLIEDIDQWLAHLAPFRKDYKHHDTGENNADSHLKALLIHHEVIVPVTGGKLDLGTWQRIFYAEFDGQRDKRVIVKVMGE
jgi:secondary thiamine-phosphate synthase enzyme